MTISKARGESPWKEGTLAKENYRELHFGSKKEMRKYFEKHPNSTVISKKEYKKHRKQQLEEDVYKKKKKQKRREKCEQFFGDAYNELKTRYDAKNDVDLCLKLFQDSASKIEDIKK